MIGASRHSWVERKVVRAESMLMKDPKQHRYMVFDQSSERKHYLELYGDRVGFKQLWLAANLTTVSPLYFCSWI